MTFRHYGQRQNVVAQAYAVRLTCPLHCGRKGRRTPCQFVIDQDSADSLSRFPKPLLARFTVDDDGKQIENPVPPCPHFLAHKHFDRKSRPGRDLWVPAILAVQQSDKGWCDRMARMSHLGTTFEPKWRAFVSMPVDIGILAGHYDRLTWCPRPIASVSGRMARASPETARARAERPGAYDRRLPRIAPRN